MIQCPMCGAQLQIEVRSGGREWTHQDWCQYSHTVGSGTAPTIEAGASWYRKEPARPPVGADVGVPAAWAGLTGVALSLLSIPVTVWAKWPWWAPLVILGGGAGLTWLALLIRWQNLLWRIEELVGSDLDGDEVVGEPQAVRVELVEPEKRQVRFIDLPVDDGTLKDVAVAVLLGGRSFSRRGLAGIISDGDFRGLQTAMLQAGLARYRDGKPNAGTELTPAGRAILHHYLP